MKTLKSAINEQELKDINNIISTTIRKTYDRKHNRKNRG